MGRAKSGWDWLLWIGPTMPFFTWLFVTFTRYRYARKIAGFVDTPHARGAVFTVRGLGFWSGHVGIMLDDQLLIHANATDMRVSIGPFSYWEEHVFHTQAKIYSVYQETVFVTVFLLSDFDIALLIPMGIALIFAGAFAGVIAGLLGVGGGIVLVPVLYFVFDALSVGVTKTVLYILPWAHRLHTIIPTSISSALSHYKRGSIDIALLKRWAIW